MTVRPGKIARTTRHADTVRIIIGLILPPVRVLYDYAWFVGFGVALVIYTVLMHRTPVVDLRAVPEVREG